MGDTWDTHGTHMGGALKHFQDCIPPFSRLSLFKLAINSLLFETDLVFTRIAQKGILEAFDGFPCGKQ